MKEIQLTQGYVALVDDDDYEFLSQYKWHLDRHPHNLYAKRNSLASEGLGRRMRFPMHRIIMKVTDKNIVIDHKDGNGLNNQKSNLRICSHPQNMMNRKPNKNGVSRYKGVYYDKDAKRWRAGVALNNRTYSVGRFKTEIEAAMAYNKKALELYGEFAQINKIESPPLEG